MARGPRACGTLRDLTHVPEAVAVGVFLAGIGHAGAVVTDVADAVGVAVRLVGIRGRAAIVTGVRDSVRVAVTDGRKLMSSRISENADLDAAARLVTGNAVADAGLYRPASRPIEQRVRAV